jgi:hypothetical protein
LFLINPFVALLTVLKDFRKREIAFFFPIFLAFIGSSIFVVGDAESHRLCGSAMRGVHDLADRRCAELSTTRIADLQSFLKNIF